MKEELRKAIVNRFGKDLEKATSQRFTANYYTFTFSNDDTVLRLGPKADRKEKLARMMWADDLKAFKDTICEPVPSVSGKLVEEFTVNNRTFSGGLYRIPRGSVADVSKIGPMFFICAGDLLGNIHKASMDQGENKMVYNIPSLKQKYAGEDNILYNRMTRELQQGFTQALLETGKTPRTSDKYGVCYGDYHINNTLVDANNIYLFDFESSVYGYYMYDIASFFASVIFEDYMIDTPSRDIARKYILPWFMIGYSINKKCDNDYWNELELFMRIRVYTMLMDMYRYDTKKINEDFQERAEARAYFEKVLQSEDIYEGIDKARAAFR